MKNINFSCIFTFLLLIIVTQCKTVRNITDKVDNLRGAETDKISSLLNKPEPITTRFSDVNQVNTLPPEFGNHVRYMPLNKQLINRSDGYSLLPGFYEMTTKSYCLHAGTYGPSKGDGYLFAPLKGAKKDIIQAIIRNSKEKRNIQQQTIQLLIWAVLAKTNFKNLSSELKSASVQLLSPKQIIELNGGALGLIPESTLDKATEKLPRVAKETILLENKMRQLFENAKSSYKEFERIAVLAGRSSDSKEFSSGIWSKHPNGYYVRYFPMSYKTTRVQVYVPKTNNTGYLNTSNPIIYAGYNVINQERIEYDGVDNVAVPANTSAQRLAQTNDPIDGGNAGNSQDAGIDANSEEKKPPCPQGEIVRTGGKLFALYKDKVLSCDYIGQGCTLAWFGNNPGAMRPNIGTSNPYPYGSIPGKTIKGPTFSTNSNDVFLMFPTYQAGRSAIVSSIKGSGNRTILDKMKGYAPRKDGTNDPVKYAEGIAKKLGVPVTTKIKDLNDLQIEQMADAIEQQEGYNDHGKGTTFSINDPKLPEIIKNMYKKCQ